MVPEHRRLETVDVALTSSESPSGRNVAPLSARFMEAILEGQRPLTRFVDPARGVTLVRYEDYSSDEGGHSNEHLCGDELRARLPELMQAHAESADSDSYTCADAPTPHCAFGGWEFGPSVTYLFVETEKSQLVLESITFESACVGGHAVEQAEKQAHFVRAWLERGRKSGCAKSPAPPR